ncbi:MAG: hypothetical protein K2G55_19070 [Lachnospiraceae bacterium]|nr:hypothetical protein [Lachnospiraceae bacterium]MDE7202810.1 hypothetical protein [Lachnospiraceae bacterium]
MYHKFPDLNEEDRRCIKEINKGLFYESFFGEDCKKYEKRNNCSTGIYRWNDIGDSSKVFKDELTHQTEMSEKHLSIYLMMNQRVRVKQENKSIAHYLEGYGYKEIAIEGMNYVSRTLLNKLKSFGVKVQY